MYRRKFSPFCSQMKMAEAVAMDPQQRLLLETVYEALEAVGQRFDQVQGTNTVVYVGVMGGDFYDIINRN